MFSNKSFPLCTFCRDGFAAFFSRINHALFISTVNLSKKHFHPFERKKKEVLRQTKEKKKLVISTIEKKKTKTKKQIPRFRPKYLLEETQFPNKHFPSSTPINRSLTPITANIFYILTMCRNRYNPSK